MSRRSFILIFLVIIITLSLSLICCDGGERPSGTQSESSGDAASGQAPEESGAPTENNTGAEDNTGVEDDTGEEETTTSVDLFELPAVEGEYVLTYENLGKLGSENNVVVFIIDRFDWEYYDRVRASAPEILYNIDDGGFTYFNDAISLYPRTFPSITYLVTGVENDFSASREEYFTSAYSRSEFMRRLYGAGYNINIYTDTYYGYTNAAPMANYADNALLAGDDVTAYSTDMRDIYYYLDENGISIGEHEKTYSFIHLSGTHLPLKYDENFELLPEGDSRRSSSTLGMKQSFKIINKYIDEMKRLGVYDNSTIIITGDHCSIGSDSEVPLRWAHVTPLIVKPSSAADGELAVSGAPVTHADIFPTILESEGINGGSPLGESVFDVSATETRKRTYYFQKYEVVDGSTNYEMVIFEIDGLAFDYSSWTIVDRYYLGKSIYK